MSYLNINYDEVRAVAKEFENQSETSDQIVGNVGSQGEQLMTNWEGHAQKTFILQLESCERRMKKVPGMLMQIAGALRYAADKIEEAEREAERAMRESMNANDGY
ncbi:MAG: WXG100 family type VII secretion target [Chloroflexota bacterium]